MNKIRGVFRNNLRERPFDFYVAALLVIIGVYSIISDTWPETLGDTFIEGIVAIISLYYMCAGIVIMASLSCRKNKHPLFALFGEMYGWMFVCFAALANVILYIASIIGHAPNSWWAWLLMLFVWLGLFISSGLRFLDLYFVYKGMKR